VADDNGGGQATANLDELSYKVDAFLNFISETYFEGSDEDKKDWLRKVIWKSRTFGSYI
jgi:hypothetical protein